MKAMTATVPRQRADRRRAGAEAHRLARADNRRALLGEFAGADNATCAQALENLLAEIDANRAVCIGWAWWAAGPWWGDYMFSLEPRAGQDAPQLAVSLKHL